MIAMESFNLIHTSLPHGLCLCFTIILLLLNNILSVEGNFGDYADPTFECPAYTTCPIVCVTNSSLCPVNMTCSPGKTLCMDGSCAANEASCSSDINSFAFACGAPYPPIACAKINDSLSSCLQIYEDAYEYQNQFSSDYVAATTTMLSFKEPVFILCYTWVSFIIVIIILWCAYNQRWSIVPGSTRPLHEVGATEYEERGDTVSWTQTGYKRGIVGTLVYALVIITLLGFQVLLLLISLSYYHLNGDITISGPVIEDEEQILLCFIIVWMVGFLFSLALKWNERFSTLFLRRSCFENATHVAVCTPLDEGKGIIFREKGCIYRVSICMGILRKSFQVMMAFIFSDVNLSSGTHEVFFCPVRKGDDKKFFYFRLRKYNFDPSRGEFIPGSCIVGKTVRELVDCKGGLSSADAQACLDIVGPNSIHMSKPSYVKSVIHEFSGTFYVYQNYIIWAWVPIYYYYMAIVYAVVVLVAGVTVAFLNFKNEETLFKLTYMSGKVKTCRDGEFEEIDHKNLAPGDVVVLHPGITFCDMIFISGTTLVVDASALTGESKPLSKTSIEQVDINSIYDPGTHKRQTILAGTTIIDCTKGSLGLVMKTGSFTTKGEMLRDILAYQRHKFKFDVEVQLVLVILLVYGIFGFLLTGFVLIIQSWIYGWFYGIYVLACVLSALLPTVFLVSVGISEKRLINKKIACSNSKGILVAGKVNKAIFDKTGTLTKEGLEFLSSRSVDKWDEKGTFVPSGYLEIGMACCHTLTQMLKGALIGNLVDKVMFQATGAKISLDVNETLKSSLQVTITMMNGETLKILKQFDFDHQRMTQSVIIQNQKGITYAFIKGSSESIKQLCCPDSVPLDFDDCVKKSAREGIYQISMAMKEISSNWQVSSRSELERDATFLGVVNFKNFLRAETKEVLTQLKEGDVDSIMVTGDSILTGIHIAKECRIIQSDTVLLGTEVSPDGKIVWVDESGRTTELPKNVNTKKGELGVDLAIFGHVWDSILEKDSKYAMELIEHICVFGRCTPIEKKSVVTAFNGKGYITSMCGDGSNDCGALKAAHVGIALSDSDASIISPFTSLNKTITSVVDVLLEGRCAIASALASYKYMIMYGQVEAINQMINAYFQVTFGEWCWVFMDGLWTITLAFALPLAKAAKRLASKRPTASLLGPHTMASVCGVLGLNFVFTCVALIALFHQDWFQCRKWGSTDVSNVVVIVDNYEAETIFLVTGYQYISAAIIYNFGYDFRAAWIKNYVLVLLVLGYTIIHVYITLVPSKLSCFFRINCTNPNVVHGITSSELMPILNPFNTTVMPLHFRWILIAIVVSNTVAVIVYDYFIVNGMLAKLLKRLTIGRKVTR